MRIVKAILWCVFVAIIIHIIGIYFISRYPYYATNIYFIKGWLVGMAGCLIGMHYGKKEE